MFSSRRALISVLIGGMFVARLSTATISSSQAAAPKRTLPLDPISAILDAFSRHKIVALGEGSHGNEQAHAFRVTLIRDPRFAATVNDIVVEVGNSRYQKVMDQFLRGEEVPNEVLRQVWRNTTAPDTVADLPIYEEFYRTVRAVNAGLPPERQLRVLLGDPPIDWDNIHTIDDHRTWIEMRNTFPADLIRREVLGKQRRALVIYGDMHLQRKQITMFIVFLLKDKRRR